MYLYTHLTWKSSDHLILCVNSQDGHMLKSYTAESVFLFFFLLLLLLFCASHGDIAALY